VVQQRISEYARKEPLPALTRSGCAYLIHVCQLEHQLFDHFFPSSAADATNLAPLIDPLCMVLYDALRPRFIHEADVDLLCELVDIVRAEVLEEQLQRRGRASRAAAHRPQDPGRPAGAALRSHFHLGLEPQAIALFR